ncbi:MAG: MFS transporter [Thermoplasmata archaeon]
MGKTYLAQFLANGSLFSAAIFVPIVLGKEMHASPLEIGFVVTGYATALFLSSVIVGRAADMKGRRVFLRIGFLIAAIGTFLQIFATSPIQLLLVRIFLGAAAGIIQSVLVAYFMYETRGKVGIFSSIGALGWGTGSLIAGIIGHYLLVFAFSAGLMLLAALLIFTLPKTKETRFEIPLFPRDVFKRNYPIYLSVLIRHTGANFVWVTYPLFLMDVLHADALWVGIIYMVNAFGQFFVMSRLDPYRSSHLIKVGFVLSALTFLGFSLAQTVIEIIPIQIMLAFAWSALYVGSLKYVMERNEEKATSTGWLQGMISIAGIIGPAIGGTLDIAIGYRLTMIAAMILSLIGLIVFLIAKKDRETMSM